MENEANIIVDNVSKTFTAERGFTCEALSNVNLKCYPNDFISILGPTGCGKSTLLRLIAGLIQPNHGSIMIERQKVTGVNGKIGMLFQENTLFPWRTILQNAMFGLENRDISEEERLKITFHFLDFMGLKNFMHAYPYEVSEGMRQRATLAQILALKVNIFLMDEPFNSLDECTRETLEEEVLRIWQTEHKTVIFVTHNIETAVYLSTRVLLMRPRPGGIVREIKVPLEIPRNRMDPDFIKYSLFLRKEFQKVVEEGSYELGMSS